MAEPRSSRTLAWLQLVRLPNVFTAMADVTMGFLFTHSALAPWSVLLLLLVASSSLYAAGTVLNDVFDFSEDRRERPDRPLPSGRVSLAAAQQLGASLLSLGVGAGVAAAFVARDWRPAALAIALAALVIAYDTALKRTPLGPVAMGGCRALNVLLGMSASPVAWSKPCWIVALGIGLYIAGVTWFSRRESTVSRRAHLAAAMLTMLAGMLMLWWFPIVTPDEDLSPLLLRQPENWTLLWLLLALVIGWRCLRAILTPTPAAVQAAVTTGILSLIVLDAAAALAVRGPLPAIGVLLLLAPAMTTSRWIYST